MMSNGEDESHRVSYCCCDDTMLNDSEQKAIGVPYQNIVSHALRTTTKFDTAINSTGIQEENQEEEDGTPHKEDECKLGDGECRLPKRRRSAETHNLTERLRRQRLKEKMRSLQQLIPNCNKKDKASTLDDAINYIKNLQYQLQVMSTGSGFTLFHSPWSTMSFQHGTQIPSLPPYYQQTRPNLGMVYVNGIGPESGINFPTNHIGFHSKQCPLPSGSQFAYGIGIRPGTESGMSSVNIPMNQMGSHSRRCSVPSGSQLPQGVSEVQTFQNAGDVSEPLTCNPLDHIIGQYERLVHNETSRTSTSSWDIPSFSEASEFFSRGW